VAVGVGADLVCAEGFGWADLETQVGVTPDTRFRIGGASMPLTSAAVGLLIEKGRLKLDDEIQTYVPAFPKKQWPVTLRQLMGHVAGIRGDAGDEESLSGRCERAADGLQRFAATPLRFEPGTQFRYSTYGWILVSAAVEVAADEPFFTFMRRQIFKPLGMNDTTPDSMSDSIPDRATFYHPRFAGDPRYGPEPVRRGDYSCFAGGGGFLSTPSDLARFGMAVNGGTLLQPATVQMLQAPQRLPSGSETGYGLGWDVETVSLAGETTRQVGHDSEFVLGGTTSLVTFQPRGIVVAITTNTTYAKLVPLAVKLAEAFAGPGTAPPPK
jgi:CubicO group peptidase (beta-lactamase class C family)